MWLFLKGYVNNLSLLRVLSAHNQILIFNTLKRTKKNKQTNKKQYIKHLKVQQNWGGFKILGGYRGSGHKITLQSQNHRITAKGEWPHCTGFKVKLHGMSLW